MGKFYNVIPESLVKWIDAQQMFWVASAPLGGEGHVNLSPKGMRGTFHVESESRVWYEDFTGSGSETMAHLREPGNGRITIMFCAFEGPPRILRIFGRGTVYEFGTPEYDALLPPEKRRPGSRCAVVIDVHKVGTSCGYGVPNYAFTAHRPTLLNWCATLESADQEFEASGSPSASPEPQVADKGLKAYWIKENLKSMDGLPAMKGAHMSSVVPKHAPPDGEWGKGGSNKPAGTVLAGKRGSAETARLFMAFSVGLGVAAAYVTLAGIA